MICLELLVGGAAEEEEEVEFFPCCRSSRGDGSVLSFSLPSSHSFSLCSISYQLHEFLLEGSVVAVVISVVMGEGIRGRRLRGRCRRREHSIDGGRSSRSLDRTSLLT